MPPFPCVFSRVSLWGDVRRLACRGSGGAGWERTGLAGGGLVLSAAAGGTQANQGMCIYAPALFCNEEGSRRRRAGERLDGNTDTGGVAAFVYYLVLIIDHSLGEDGLLFKRFWSDHSTEGE